MIQSSNNSILSILDDTCIFPQGTDATFLNKIYSSLENNKNFLATPKHRGQSKFVIYHYAGQVTYDASGFCEKNRDALMEDATALIQSASGFTAALFSQDPNDSDYRKSCWPKKNQIKSKRGSLITESVGSQYKNQLQLLMNTLETTAPHFIRCLKPNDSNVPDRINKSRLVEQLRYSGVLEAVRVARAGFPVRYSHKEFIDRYGIIEDQTSSGKSNNKDPRDLLKCLHRYFGNRLKGPVSANVTPVTEVAPKTNDISTAVGIFIGRTRVFMKKRAFEVIETIRAETITAFVVRIQKLIRGAFARVKFEKLKLMHRSSILISVSVAPL